MWKAFAVFYGLLFIVGIGLVFYPLPPEVALQLSAADKTFGYASLAAAFVTATGLIAYAFDLHVPPFALWRPTSWLLGGWMLFASLVSVWDFVTLLSAPQPGSEGAISALAGLLVNLLISYFGWLGVWRYGRRMRAIAQ